MKKKLALVIISIDECFPSEGFSGGGHKVTKNLILGLVNSGLFEIDIFSKKGSDNIPLEGIRLIKVLKNKTNFLNDLRTELEKKDYDYILASDVLIPFGNNVLHSNSSKYKSKNGKNKILQQVLKIYNSKKIKAQQECFTKDTKAIFTVSESLKNDFVKNYKLNPNNVFVSYPGIDSFEEFKEEPQKEFFTIGSMAGGGLNKGGYLLLLALSKLPKGFRIKARIIFPKIKKAFFFKLAVKLLGLETKVEILPKQSNMSEFYKTIDCYVLPSLNEAFGLVVTEAAAIGKPSLVTSTAGASELIEDNINGFIFDRINHPLRNLTRKLIEISDLYLKNNKKYTEICKNAQEIAKKLDWKNFSDIIIKHMIKEA